MMDLLSYRGTDVHVDTLSFYRPDRLPTRGHRCEAVELEDHKGLEVEVYGTHKCLRNGGSLPINEVEG